MGSVMIWLKSFFAFVFWLLKGLFGLTETVTENKHVVAAVAKAKATVAAAIAADCAFAAAQTTEQRKYAFASVAAVEAATDTAVAAAQAVVAAVRLASHVRGYLATKALRALKELVKLLALVRGYLMKKHLTTSLYAMQAPIRAQAIVCSPINCRLICNNMNDDIWRDHKVPRDIRRLSTYLETSFDTVDKSPKKMKVDPKHKAYTQSYKAKMRTYKATKQGVEPKAGPKKRFSNVPNTSTNSVCADKFVRANGKLTTYMAYTRSFKAKCRRIP